MPAAAHASTTSRRLLFPAVIWLKLSRVRSGIGSAMDLPLIDPCQGKYRLHSRSCQFGVGQQAGLVCVDEQLCEMLDRAGAFLTLHHAEVLLVPVQISEEDEACLVV